MNISIKVRRFRVLALIAFIVIIIGNFFCLTNVILRAQAPAGLSIDYVMTTDYVERDWGDYDDTMVVLGSGVTAGEDVKVGWDSLKVWDGEKGILNSTVAKGDGTFEVWFKVSEAVVGTHYIWVKDMGTGDTAMWTMDFNVVARIKMSPSSGLPDEDITLYGYGFTLEEYIVTIKFNGVDLETNPSFPETNALGSWEATFKVPSLACDDYEVYAADANGVYAINDFKIARVQDIKIAVQLKGGLEAGQHLLAAMEDFSNVEWTVVLEDLTAFDLADVDMLILIQSDMAVDYTTVEKAAVKTWFQGAGKTVWVCADSDFSDQYLRISTANDMLENLGSKLRGESAEAADLTSNAEGAYYRVLGLTENIDPEVDYLADGVNSALFHGPGLIVGYIGDTYYKLEETEIDDIYIIVTTSRDGIVIDYEPPAPELHDIGEEGFLPLLVMEKYANGNVLYVGADAPFAHYMPMYKPEIRNSERYSVLHTQEGAKLFENIFNYAIRTKLRAHVHSQYDIILYEGWNLIGLPFAPEDPSIEVILADILDKVESVWTYDGHTKTWSSYAPGAPSDLTEMVEERGYWIKVKEDAILTIHGRYTDEEGIVTEVEAEPGTSCFIYTEDDFQIAVNMPTYLEVSTPYSKSASKIDVYLKPLVSLSGLFSVDVEIGIKTKIFAFSFWAFIDVDVTMLGDFKPDIIRPEWRVHGVSMALDLEGGDVGIYSLSIPTLAGAVSLEGLPVGEWSYVSSYDVYTVMEPTLVSLGLTTEDITIGPVECVR